MQDKLTDWLVCSAVEAALQFCTLLRSFVTASVHMQHFLAACHGVSQSSECSIYTALCHSRHDMELARFITLLCPQQALHMYGILPGQVRALIMSITLQETFVMTS